jgi:hypothetical protein
VWRVQESPSQPIARHDHTHLSSQMHGRLRLRVSWFQASSGKKSLLDLISTENPIGLDVYHPSYDGQRKIGGS